MFLDVLDPSVKRDDQKNPSASGNEEMAYYFGDSAARCAATGKVKGRVAENSARVFSAKLHVVAADDLLAAIAPYTPEKISCHARGTPAIFTSTMYNGMRDNIRLVTNHHDVRKSQRTRNTASDRGMM